MTGSLRLTSRKNDVTKQQLITDLTKIGVTRGDHLAVTLSLNAIGHVVGGPETLIDALVETVGPEGTVMMNTYTRTFPIYAIDEEFVFDSERTVCWTGIVPETLRKRKNAIRSNNPVCSVVAIGKKAEYLTRDHLNSSLHVPYERLAKINGKYLAIGLGNELVAIRHQAQRQAGLCQLLERPNAVRYRDPAEKIKLFIFNEAPCTKSIQGIVPLMESAKVLERGKIGNASAWIASAREFLDYLTHTLKRNPATSLCQDPYCLWCREIERKLNLYGQIGKPRYFQKSRIIREAIALGNHIRLKKYSYISFRNSALSTFWFPIPIFGFVLNGVRENLPWTIVDLLKLRPRFDFNPRIQPEDIQ